MTRPTLTSIYLYGILAIFLGIVVHAPLTVAFGTLLPEWAEPIKAWKEILMLLLAVIAGTVVTRRKLWPQLLADKVIWAALAYVDLHLLLSLLMPGDLPSIIAGLMIDLRFIAFFVLAYILTVLHPGARRAVMRSVAAGAAVVLGFGLLQITILPDDILRSVGYGDGTIRPFTTIDQNTDYVRINSTLRGPNPLGAICVLYGALALTYLVQRGRTVSSKRRWLVGVSIVASVAVLFASYSRSAYVAFAVTSALAVVMTFRKMPSLRIVTAGVAAAFVGVVGLVLLQSSDWYSNVILHENPDSTISTKSNQEHVDSLNDGLERAERQPFGAGVGSTGSASMYDGDPKNDVIIENWYLFVAHESGWIGLTLFLALGGIIFVRLWQRRTDWVAFGLLASGIGLALIGLLLPVWADDTVALVWWGLAGAILGGDYAKRTRQ